MQEQLSLREQAHERGTLGLLRAAGRTNRAAGGWVNRVVGKQHSFAAAANDSFLSGQQDLTQISPVSIASNCDSVRCKTDALDGVGDEN